MYRELELEQHCFWWTKTNENGKNLTNGSDEQEWIKGSANDGWINALFVKVLIKFREIILPLKTADKLKLLHVKLSDLSHYV